jgi:hypothetical protein
MFARVAALALLALGWPSAAFAEGWTDAFPPSTTSSWVVGEKPRLLIVEAGGGAELREAAAALTNALRSGARTSLVMTGESLGDVSKLGDNDIVARAKGLPVEQVIVLRVFSGGDKAPPTAVATFYDKDGKVLSALTTQKGIEVAARPPSSATTRGVSSETAEAVSQVAKSIPDGTDPREEYEKKFIGFDDLAVVNAQTGALVSTQTLPYQGKFKKPIDGQAFYALVGREDLASTYGARSTAKTVAVVGGGTGLLAGLVVMMAPLVSPEPCESDFTLETFTACHDRRSAAMKSGLVTGSVIGGVGAVALIIGAAINPHPVTPAEARELADGYNKKLKKELGITEVTPVVGPNGGGLAVAGRF